MSLSTELKIRIINSIIQPTFEKEAIKKKARKCGYDIDAHFTHSELNDFSTQLSEKIFQKIATFCTENKQPISSQVIQETFSPIIQQELKKICQLSSDWFNNPSSPPVLWKWICNWISSFSSRS